MRRFTHSGPSISRKTVLQLVVSLTVRSVAYASLIGNMIDGTLMRLVQGWLLMLPANSIGLAQQWLHQYGSSCVIALLMLLLARWGYKITSR